MKLTLNLNEYFGIARHLLTLQETRSIHDSMNIPKIEIHFLNICNDKIDLQKKKKQFYSKIVTCELSIHAMDYPKFIVSNQNQKRNPTAAAVLCP